MKILVARAIFFVIALFQPEGVEFFVDARLFRNFVFKLFFTIPGRCERTPASWKGTAVIPSPDAPPGSLFAVVVVFWHTSTCLSSF